MPIEYIIGTYPERFEQLRKDAKIMRNPLVYAQVFDLKQMMADNVATGPIRYRVLDKIAKGFDQRVEPKVLPLVILHNGQPAGNISVPEENPHLYVKNVISAAYDSFPVPKGKNRLAHLRAVLRGERLKLVGRGETFKQPTPSMTTNDLENLMVGFSATNGFGTWKLIYFPLKK